MPLIECVPNVSEGRRADVIAALGAALAAPGVHMLDRSSDPSHNRTVYTFAGEPGALRDAVLRLFAAAVDRVSAISSEKSRAVKLTLGNKSLVLSASSPDAGSATEELEVSYQGGDMDIGFNAGYLLDITRQIAGDTTRLMLADAASPTIFSEVDDAGALYVLMPMRV